MNRMVLVLNVVVLVVTFLLALAAQDAQIGIMQTTNRVVGARRVAAPGGDPAAMAYFRVVQSLENFATPAIRQRLTAVKLRTVHRAVQDYFDSINRSVGRLLYDQAGDAKALERAYAAAGKDAREIVKHALAQGFSDSGFIDRLTAEIIRNSR